MYERGKDEYLVTKSTQARNNVFIFLIVKFRFVTGAYNLLNSKHPV